LEKGALIEKEDIRGMGSIHCSNRLGGLKMRLEYSEEQIRGLIENMRSIQRRYDVTETAASFMLLASMIHAAHVDIKELFRIKHIGCSGGDNWVTGEILKKDAKYILELICHGCPNKWEVELKLK